MSVHHLETYHPGYYAELEAFRVWLLQQNAHDARIRALTADVTARYPGIPTKYLPGMLALMGRHQDAAVYGDLNQRRHSILTGGEPMNVSLPVRIDPGLWERWRDAIKAVWDDQSDANVAADRAAAEAVAAAVIGQIAELVAPPLDFALLRTDIGADSFCIYYATEERDQEVYVVEANGRVTRERSTDRGHLSAIQGGRQQ